MKPLNEPFVGRKKSAKLNLCLRMKSIGQYLPYMLINTNLEATGVYQGNLN